jgi:hypothetical protein
MRRGLALGLACVVSAGARADAELSRHLGDLWSAELGLAPATPALLLLEMANDAQLAERVLARAGAAQRALTDTLLSTLEWSEAQAVSMLPQLHVVRDDSPPPALRPPSWAQLRWQGMLLFERIAPDPQQGRDLRLLRALAERRERVERWTPSEIAGLVVLASQWWIDRGDDAAFYLTPQQRPTVDAWFAARTGDGSLWTLLAALHDDPLRRRMLLERLSASEHAFLSAECMAVLGSYADDFMARDMPPRRWDAKTGRMVGYDEVDLRAIALEALPRVSPHNPSGMNEHEQIRDAFLWWRRARYQARYYRDARRGAPPVLPRVLWDVRPPAEGGLPMHEWLKELYSHDELRTLVLEEVGSQHAPLVAELIEWLGYSLEEARAAGFNFAERRFPLRPDPTSKGVLYIVPWASVQLLIRDLLAVITQHELVGGEALDAEAADAQWRAWWANAQADPRWYRDGAKRPAPGARFEPQRGRSGG